MKVIFIALTIFLLGCSSLQLSSPKDVYKEALGQYSDIADGFYITDTITEYVYVASTSSGFVVLFNVEKRYPHKITKRVILFYCDCDNFKNRS